VGLRAEQHPQEKTWLTLKVLRKRFVAPGGEKEAVAQRKVGVLSGVNRAPTVTLHGMPCQPRHAGSSWSKR
jgi:hypothetical protein